MSIQNLQNAIENVRHTLSGSPSDLNKSIRALKQALIGIPSMPPSNVHAAEELTLIRTAYELALQAYIQIQDTNGIEQCFDMLKVLYFDYTGVIGASEHVWKVLGLYLTYLLSFNKITEFHTELEAIPFKERANKFIRFAVELENFFMEGNYQQVLDSKDNVPAQEFSFFVNRILDTIRFEIAASFEKAYDSLHVNSACELLRLNSRQELSDFISVFEKERQLQKEWALEGDWLKLKGEEEKKSSELQNWHLISQAVSYAVELERIV